MPGLGATELIIILVLILLLFGASRLPKLARSMGQAQREFKEGVGEAGAEAEAKKRGDLPEASERVARPTAGSGGPGDEKVTLTKAELDALLAEREARAREEPPPSS